MIVLFFEYINVNAIFVRVVTTSADAVGIHFCFIIIWNTIITMIVLFFEYINVNAIFVRVVTTTTSLILLYLFLLCSILVPIGNVNARRRKRRRE